MLHHCHCVIFLQLCSDYSHGSVDLLLLLCGPMQLLLRYLGDTLSRYYIDFLESGALTEKIFVSVTVVLGCPKWHTYLKTWGQKICVKQAALQGPIIANNEVFRGARGLCCSFSAVCWIHPSGKPLGWLTNIVYTASNQSICLPLTVSVFLSYHFSHLYCLFVFLLFLNTFDVYILRKMEEESLSSCECLINSVSASGETVGISPAQV